MSKAKGKQAVKSPYYPSSSSPVILNPASGSASPSSSLSTLWAYLEPALDHIVKSPSNDPGGKAPSIDVGLYAGIHSACYNYFTSQNEAANALARSMQPEKPIGNDNIYAYLDKYFATAVRELVLGVPDDDTALIDYIIPCFNRYSAGAQSVNRLLSYVNRHYVKRAIDEDRGWLRLSDVLEFVAKTVTAEDTREKISKRMKEKKINELQKWGYFEGGPPDLMSASEACAEAASPPDRVVPIASLAMRRFRTEFIEPLLAVPKVKKGTKAKQKALNAGSAPPGPKGRLARAVKDLLESQFIEEEERTCLARELAKILRVVGVRPDHPLRKKLDKFTSLSY